MKDIQLITKQIDNITNLKKEYENENLTETFEKIKNNEKYRNWFLLKNIKLILALIESEGYIAECDYNRSGEGYKPTEIRLNGTIIQTGENIYEIPEDCILSNKEEETVTVISRTDEFIGEIIYQVHDIFKDILEFYRTINYKQIVYEKCTKCKFLIVCEHNCELKEGD